MHKKTFSRKLGHLSIYLTIGGVACLLDRPVLCRRGLLGLARRVLGWRRPRGSLRALGASSHLC